MNKKFLVIPALLGAFFCLSSLTSCKEKPNIIFEPDVIEQAYEDYKVNGNSVLYIPIETGKDSFFKLLKQNYNVIDKTTNAKVETTITYEGDIKFYTEGTYTITLKFTDADKKFTTKKITISIQNIYTVNFYYSIYDENGKKRKYLFKSVNVPVNKTCDNPGIPPANSGQRFSYWVDSQGNIFDFNKQISKNISLNAVYQSDYYYVYFKDFNGDTIYKQKYAPGTTFNYNTSGFQEYLANNNLTVKEALNLPDIDAQIEQLNNQKLQTTNSSEIEKINIQIQELSQYHYRLDETKIWKNAESKTMNSDLILEPAVIKEEHTGTATFKNVLMHTIACDYCKKSYDVSHKYETTSTNAKPYEFVNVPSTCSICHDTIDSYLSPTIFSLSSTNKADEFLISKVYSQKETLVIPSEIDYQGQKVKIVGAENFSFYNLPNLKAIKIEGTNGFNFDEYTFYNVANLKYILVDTFENNITYCNSSIVPDIVGPCDTTNTFFNQLTMSLPAKGIKDMKVYEELVCSEEEKDFYNTYFKIIYNQQQFWYINKNDKLVIIDGVDVTNLASNSFSSEDYEADDKIKITLSDNNLTTEMLNSYKFNLSYFTSQFAKKYSKSFFTGSGSLTISIYDNKQDALLSEISFDFSKDSSVASGKVGSFDFTVRYETDANDPTKVEYKIYLKKDSEIFYISDYYFKLTFTPNEPQVKGIILN